jgi:hypothetical protein
MTEFSVACGAEGRSRTADTRVFSAVLYQLSYLGHTLVGPPNGRSQLKSPNSQLGAC